MAKEFEKLSKNQVFFVGMSMGLVFNELSINFTYII